MADSSIRIDKWLWYARVVKTRTLAQKLVKSGKVRLNRDKITNPSKTLTLDDVLTIALERKVLVLKVEAIGTRRGPYSEAVLLYEDLSEPIEPVENNKATQQSSEKVPRPDKQERRKLLALKNRQYYN